ncbi:MATE family efflux transporter [Endozoicomonas sp. SM1973]|uniref:Multidrug-efflux transporter n=1 Tax=Spartinivicinus marinus TaxID=2994442 RepID=A0A853IFK6_9GAMM|nr:MATE family efflux transporter [Spartinivicinus marinus]MCX4029601.1 MATE family efflux transporter [Spartinivicinus marinus]NYZ68814.1 MATE family efflux transporter [Spartinivicinus marinus]
MTQTRLKALLTLGLPIMGAMMSQSLLNLVDAAMVGSLGEVALAGVGFGSYVNFICVACLIGLSSGVQTLVARRVGEGTVRSTPGPVIAGLWLSLLGALPVSLLLFLLGPLFIHWLNADTTVAEAATPYFQARVLGMFGVALNFCFRGFWNGISQSMVYLRALLIMHVLNVVISYCLIFGVAGLPAMGAMGAGLGTTLSLYIGSAMYAWLCWRDRQGYRWHLRWPGSASLRQIMSLSWPHSLQQVLFAFGVTVLFWIISLVGTHQLAVAHVLISLALFLILPGVGLGMAATSLVSQAIGRKEQEDAYQWGWDVVKVSAGILVLLGAPFIIWPEFILGIFLKAPEVIAMGVMPLQITGMMMVIDAAALVLSQALIGAGANKTVMAVNLSSQWLLFLPMAAIIGPVLGYGLVGIWCLQAFQRLINSSIYGWIWYQRKWQKIRL